MASSVHDPGYRIFCRLIVACRHRQGLTQTQLADRLNRPQSFVSKYENGERRMDLIELMEVTEALGVDASEFVRELQTILAEKTP
jgi:transcriptional regulator with XRE-family HTH domain